MRPSDSYCFNLKTASFGQSNNLRTFSYRKATLEKLFAGVTDSMEVTYVSRPNSCFYIWEITGCCSQDFTRLSEHAQPLLPPLSGRRCPPAGHTSRSSGPEMCPVITQPDCRTNGLGAFAVLIALLVKGDMANPFLSLPLWDNYPVYCHHWCLTGLYNS